MRKPDYMGRSKNEIAQLKYDFKHEAHERWKRIGITSGIILGVGAVIFAGAVVAGTQAGPKPGCVVVANSGDTERDLAQRSHTNFLDMQALNPHKDLGNIAAGQPINVSTCGDLGEDHTVTPLK